MAICTFFGHRDCPETIKPKLREVLVDLITNHDVDMFYVGHQGQFDAYVHSELKKLKQEYPQINYAISWRNNWMLKQSDYVVTYIAHSYGGAAQYARKAKKQFKKVIDLINEGQLE